VTENWVQTTVDGWSFHVMVKASELLERFDVVLVVNRHNDPALLIQLSLNMQSARECQARRAKATSFMRPSSFSCWQRMMHQLPRHG
jgi:hypothetical protein